MTDFNFFVSLRTNYLLLLAEIVLSTALTLGAYQTGSASLPQRFASSLLFNLK